MGSEESSLPSIGEQSRIVAVCGLTREADLLARSAVHVIAGGGVRFLLEQRLQSTSSAYVAGIISVGICGALDSRLKIGDCVIGSEVVAGLARWPVDGPWMRRLVTQLPDAITGAIAGTDVMLIGPGQKHTLHRETKAIAADMESHVAAAFALACGIPFAVLRVVSDDAGHALPPAVLKAMKLDGGVNVPSVLASLLRNPGQLPALLRTARDSELAFRALLRCLDLLGPRFMGPDLGELSLDVG